MRRVLLARFPSGAAYVAVLNAQLACCGSTVSAEPAPPPATRSEVRAPPAGPSGRAEDIASSRDQSAPRVSASSTLQVIPLGIIHVTLAGVDVAPLADVSVREGLEIRTRVDASYRATYAEPGHRRWFFHAFDAAHLVFLVARYEPKPVRGGTYIAEQRYRVARSASADTELGVADIVRQYEIGEQGVRAGMSPGEVEAVLGAQHETRQLGPIGSFDYIYPTVCVRFLSSKAADIMPRASCGP